MKLTKKNNGFIAFLLVAITLNTCCMDQVKKEDIGWATIVGDTLLGSAVAIKQLFFPTPDEPFPFTDLPKDLQNQIIQLLSINTTAESLQVAAQTIRSLAQVNKELNALINDPDFCLKLIKNLAQRFNCSDMEAASALHTQEAQRRLMVQKKLNNNLNTFISLGTEDQSTLEGFLLDIEFTLNSLIQNEGVSLEFTSPFGESSATPLMLCCAKTHLPVILTLIARGIKLNARNNDGNTALMICLLEANNFTFNRQYANRLKEHFIFKEYIKVIQVLLNAGADPEIANNAGLTPLAAAQQTDNQELIDLIQNAINKKHGKIKLE